ncbi:MAG: Zn-ribbon domain-containing OB-fold protein [Chloroflexi bacterium]|nr:MAG: Zn-ribbon domain-containing OB-fold protein [Chloroflexota bacterium]
MDLPRHWRLRNQRYHLEGVVCENCDARLFPPRQICPECRSRDLRRQWFQGKGHVFTYSVVHQAPLGFTKFEPYIVALVELENGPIVTAQLTDVRPEDVHIGMPVEMVIRKLREYGEEGLIVYGYKFRPRIQLN